MSVGGKRERETKIGRSVPLPLPSPTLLLEPKDFNCSRLLPPWSSSPAVASSSTTRCSARSNGYIPKLKPFSRSKFDRIVKDPPLIQKSENEIAGTFQLPSLPLPIIWVVSVDIENYCSVLEGDASHSCWRAYFELKDLEKEIPKENVEKLILQAGGVKSLISCLHGISAIHKAKKESSGFTKMVSEQMGEVERTDFRVPDGIPKSAQELKEEEEGRMPDSAFTRMLRTKGRFPA
ncbi:hypothetical protein NMG60_11019646, partial [Bertholletia excelsa]